MHGLVLTAAGGSTRFGGGASKVLLDLCGKPVLCHSLDTFRAALPGIVVVVTTRAEDENQVRGLAADATVLRGGETRQASVARGVAALPDDIEVVMVHDAARPLATVPLVTAVLDAALAHGAAAAVTPVADTLHGLRGTLGDHEAWLTADGADRHALAAAATPQAARSGLLREAIRAAEADGVLCTDEVGLLLRIGARVAAVPGDATNVKITTPTDLELAACILEARAS
jgi:2-C-methyl-D-erythritol 4-phosphate cytidylyltransferase